jgi:hypothetical protein
MRTDSEEKGLNKWRLQLCVQCGLQWIHSLSDVRHGDHVCEISGAVAVCWHHAIGLMTVEIKEFHFAH